MEDKIIQIKINPNRAAISSLSGLGFSIKDIRLGLIAMNHVDITNLSEKHGIPRPTLYNTRKNHRLNDKAMRAFSDALGLDVNELYPESVKNC